MILMLELVNGLKVGIEHVTAEAEEDEYHWAIVLDLLVLRFVFMKVK